MTSRRVAVRAVAFGALTVASVVFGRDLWPVVELVLVPPFLLLLWWVATKADDRIVRGGAALLAATVVLLIGAAVTDSVVVDDVAEAARVEFGRPFPWITQDVRPQVFAEDLPTRVHPFAYGSVDDPRLSYPGLARSAVVMLLVAASFGAGAHLVHRHESDEQRRSATAPHR